LYKSLADGLASADGHPVRGRLLRPDDSNGGGKAVAASGHGLDELQARVVPGERLAEQKDVLGQIALFDE